MDPLASVSGRGEVSVNGSAELSSFAGPSASLFLKEVALESSRLLVHGIVGICAVPEFPAWWTDSDGLMDLFASISRKDEIPINGSAQLSSLAGPPTSLFLKELALESSRLLVHGIVGICAAPEFPAWWTDSDGLMDLFPNVSRKDEIPVNGVCRCRVSRRMAELLRPSIRCRSRRSAVSRYDP